MKTIGAGLLAHLQGETTALCTLWRVTRRDGQVLAFTDHDQDLVVGGVTYRAAVGYSATAIEASSGMNVDNLDVEAVLDDAGITEADLIAGRYDFAAIEIMAANWVDPSQGTVTLRKGILGQVTLGQVRARTELRGLAQRLQQQVGRVYARRCDADLGDARCGVALAGWTVAGTVTAVASREQFTADTVPTRNEGKLTWATGANAGLAMEIRALSGSTITLFEPMPYDVAIGDTFSAYAGCDKNRATCRDVFNNMVNFRGFPDLPGTDQLLLYPDAH